MCTAAIVDRFILASNMRASRSYIAFVVDFGMQRTSSIKIRWPQLSVSISMVSVEKWFGCTVNIGKNIKQQTQNSCPN